MPEDHTALFQAWKAVSEAAGGLLLLDPIETAEQHAAALSLLEVVWDAEEDRPELGGLLSLLVENIHEYEEVAFPRPASPPHRLLATLMEYQEVSPAALAQATGIEQEELGRLLTGEQDFTRQQMHVLAEHLHVSPEIFV